MNQKDFYKFYKRTPQYLETSSMKLYKPNDLMTFGRIRKVLDKLTFEEQQKMYKDTDILQIPTNRVDRTLFFYTLNENYWKHL